MSKRIELLAPAGDWDAFVAAVENGADAVYLGSKQFNARQFAGNFDEMQLEKAIDYAHVRDVNVYLTMNTLMSDDELKEGLNLAEEIYPMGIDGFIVHDLGLAGLLRRYLPDADLHASTQMTIYNLEGVRTLEKLGFKRVVLARELSLGEIKNITQNTELEVEIFVHGALCVCYSGQCLMSSIIGGRSGNRGKCAQPCRLPFELLGDKAELNSGMNKNGKISMDSRKGYILSPKDISSVDIIKDVVESGVKSLKIEGRMKSPEYVATVVRIYRKYLDLLDQSKIKTGSKHPDLGEDLKDLTQVFNRGGFSKGYLQGKQGRDMMCYEKPKNWGTYLGEVIDYDKRMKRVTVKLEDQLTLGDGVEIWNGQNDSPGSIITQIRRQNENVEKADKGNTVAIASISGSICKGNKVYKTSSKSLNEAAKMTFNGKSIKKVTLDGSIQIRKDAPLLLNIKDNQGNEVEMNSSYVPEIAINKPATSERIAEQLNKTGSTPFIFRNIKVELDDNLVVPVSEINDLRRKALEEIQRKRVQSRKRIMFDKNPEKKNSLLYFLGNSRKKIENPRLSVFFYKMDKNFDFSRLTGADRLYLPFTYTFEEKSLEILAQLCQEEMEIFLWLPNITRGNYDRIIKDRIDLLLKSGIHGFVLGNPGSIEYFNDDKHVKMMGDFTLNTYNSHTIKEYYELGLTGVTLSVELNLSQMRDLKDIEGITKEAVVYGRIPLMTSEYCAVGSIAGGKNTQKSCDTACNKGSYHLKDRMGAEFPLLCDRIDCRSTVFNSNVLFALESIDKIKSAGIDMVRINILDEDIYEVQKIVNMHRDIIDNGIQALENHRAFVDEIKDRGFTKGHYYRGV